MHIDIGNASSCLRLNDKSGTGLMRITKSAAEPLQSITLLQTAAPSQKKLIIVIFQLKFCSLLQCCVETNRTSKPAVAGTPNAWFDPQFEPDLISLNKSRSSD